MTNGRLNRTAERRYQLEIKRNLSRNFAVHLVHGMLGQTGFRLLNAPTFLPAYLLMLSDGSTMVVGLALALQSLGTMLTPLFVVRIVHLPSSAETGQPLACTQRRAIPPRRGSAPIKTSAQ